MAQEESKVGACPFCRTPLAITDETCPTCGEDVEGAAEHSKFARETEDRPDPGALGREDRTQG
jgi:hypothetical protein